MSSTSYRPARRALYAGLLSVALHVAGIVWASVALFRESENLEAFASNMATAETVALLYSLLGNVVALVGIAYAAIASHRSEWGAALVIAWVLNVLGAMGTPFVFVAF
ncbi:MAG: hypothetical protein ACE5F1_03715 [Planctomycetota bacterium]